MLVLVDVIIMLVLVDVAALSMLAGYFLGLREWAVNHRVLVAGEPHSRTLGTWLQPVAIEHHAGLHHLLVELRHGGEQLLGGHLAGFGVLSRFDHHHEAPWSFPS